MDSVNSLFNAVETKKSDLPEIFLESFKSAGEEMARSMKPTQS